MRSDEYRLYIVRTKQSERAENPALQKENRDDFE